MNTAPPLCGTCGSPLPGGALAGFCPACAWRGTVFGGDDFEESSAAVHFSRSIPGHEILGEIARGGMGIVYRARQSDPPREVALKMMLPHQLGSEEQRERFRAEARAIAGLEHPAILPVHQVGEHEGLPWFTMKLADGGSLAQRREALAGRWRDIATLVATLADAVRCAHEHGVLHRDLKPGNILFDRHDRPYVSDFGLAKFLHADAALTATQSVMGTPAYLAPELLGRTPGGATTAADVYGLGAVLYELLSGRPPFAAPTLGALLQRIEREPPVPPGASRADVPRDLEILALKCLGKDPARRCASAHELAEELRRWLAGRPILARAASPGERLAAWAVRNPAVATLSAVLAVALLAGAGLLAERNRSLRTALERSENSEREARGHLRDSLLAQVEGLNQTTRLGRRAEGLALLARAAALTEGTNAPSLLAAMRTEAVTTFTRLDAVPDGHWLHPALGLEERFVSAMPELDAYWFIHAGGADLWAASNQTRLRHLELPAGAIPRGHFLRAEANWLGVWFADGSAAAWSLGDESRPRLFESGPGAVIGMDFHPGPQGVALARGGSGAEIHFASGPPRRIGDGNEVLGVRFSPDGKRLGLVTARGIELWRLDQAVPTRVWEIALAQPAHRLTWHPEGRVLLAASRWENAVVVLNAASGAVVSRHAGHAQDPVRFDFHPGGRLAASAGRDGTVRLWDWRTGRDELVLPGTEGLLRFSADGRRFAVAPGPVEIGIHKLLPEDGLREFAGGSGSPSEPVDVFGSVTRPEVFTVSGGGVRRWDVAAGEQREHFPLSGESIRSWGHLVEGGEGLIYGRRESGGWRRNLGSAAASEREPVPLSLPPNSVVWDVGRSGSWLVGTGGALELWPSGDAARARVVARGLGGLSVRFSPDERWLALVHRANRVVQVVEVATGRVLAELAGGALAVPGAWWSSDGTALLTSGGSAFRLWTAGSWNELHAWPQSNDGKRANAAAISPDGRWLALEVVADEFALVARADGRELMRLRAPRRFGVMAAVFSPDSTKLWLAGSGPSLFEWDLSRLREELARHGLGWTP